MKAAGKKTIILTLCAAGAIAVVTFTLFSRSTPSENAIPVSTNNVSEPTTATKTRKSAKVDFSGTNQLASPQQSEESRLVAIRTRLRSVDDFRSIYDELVPNESAEAHFFKGLILGMCAREPQNFPNEIPPPSFIPAELRGLEHAARNRYLANLRAREPRAVCRGFAGVKIDANAGLLENAKAVAKGDIRARARELELRTLANLLPLALSAGPRDENRARYDDINYGLGIGEADFALIKQVIASKDPTAILTAGPLLTGAYRDSTLYVGDRSLEDAGAALALVWEGIACQFSTGCQLEQMNYLKVRCVVSNRCDAQDFDGYARQYVLTAGEYAVYARLKAQIEYAIQTNDWKAFRIGPASAIPIGGYFSRIPRPLKVG